MAGKKKSPTIRPVITLLTDFGQRDEYVGVMKGVLLRHCEDAQLVDISHAVPPQDTAHAARILSSAFPYFPEGSIHLVVVDPGVGSERNILLIECADYFFIGPDNGVFSPVLNAENPLKCYALHKAAGASFTFHGRDVMAPAAGKLAAGHPPRELGEEISPKSCITLDLPAAKIEDNMLVGEITAIDHFGNAASTISAEDLKQFGDKLHIIIGDSTIDGLHRTYSEVAAGELVALIDSRGFLEIAVNCGSCAEKIACRPGYRVVVKKP